MFSFLVISIKELNLTIIKEHHLNMSRIFCVTFQNCIIHHNQLLIKKQNKIRTKIVRNLSTCIKPK